jgi:hypothetical protein
MFATFSTVRLVSYAPQILRIARDCNGASAISYATWLIWLGTNVATALHAAVNLHDTWLAFVSAGYGVSCAAVIALTAYKRLSHRRRRKGNETSAV